jgi:hypothetical protein
MEELEKLIEKLQTVEGKTAAIVEAVENRRTTNPDYIERTFQYYADLATTDKYSALSGLKNLGEFKQYSERILDAIEKMKDYVEAAEFAHKNELIERAILNYERSGNFIFAAKNCEEHALKLKTENPDAAIAYAVRAETYFELAKALGHEKAIALFAKKT